MPLTVPKLDARTYQDLFDEAVARIPVHTPEWTNFNKSDPGITILGVVSFLTESLLYRCNQIPERNRRKFLSLLGVPLSPASAARGIVSFTNDRGPLAVFPLTSSIEVTAGQVPFRTEDGLDVLPIEVRAYYKQGVPDPDSALVDYYASLYASYTDGQQPPPTLSMYELETLGPGGASSVDLGVDTVDGSLWIAILARETDKNDLDLVRQKIGGKTLSLGMVPGIPESGARLAPGQQVATPDLSAILSFAIPKIDGDGALPKDVAQRLPTYRRLDTTPLGDVLHEPGVVELSLPPWQELTLWSNLDPLESGVGQFPPSLEDTTENERLLTWIRVTAIAPSDVEILWVGANAATVVQRAHVAGEILADGTGEPDQARRLAHRPILPSSVVLTVTPATGTTDAWDAIDDLMDAGPEVPSVDPRLPPGSTAPDTRPPRVFVEDAEAGTITFGDGTRGRRPPTAAQIRVDYDYSLGAAGNLEAGALTSGPALPPGIAVDNPVRTWGGADAETVDQGEKQISRYLQHRDRLVTKADFEALAFRTPGVSLGRVDVLPAFHPILSPNEPGDAPGTVTLMVLPGYDPDHPDAPEPSQEFLQAIASWLEPRRLVTTEIFLRGPIYRDVWLSLGIGVVAGASARDVSDAVKTAVTAFLSPLPASGTASLDDTVPFASASTPSLLQVDGGWPLRKQVVALEVLAVASRVPGVRVVNAVILANATGAAVDKIEITGLELPRLAGLSIAIGDAVDIDELRGKKAVATQTGRVVPIPIVPENC